MKLFSIMSLAFLLSMQSFAHSKNYETIHYPKHSKGLKRTILSHHFMTQAKHMIFKNVGSVPGSLDLSSKVSLPENQGTCGSCWVFALTKTLRSEYMISGNDPGVLEFNYLLDNCGPGPEMNGCQGGDFSAAESFLKASGPGLNSEDPYLARETLCKNLPVKATALSYSMLGNSEGPSFEDIAYALSLKHVLSIDVAAGMGDWENYSNGIYDECAGTENDIDHMINVVGYNCQTSIDAHGNCQFDSKGKPIHGDGYLIVMNNWGEDWGTQAANGHGGYMKTRMYDKNGAKCNAIATNALFFEIGPQVTPSKCEEKFLCSLFNCHLFWC